MNSSRRCDIGTLPDDLLVAIFSKSSVRDRCASAVHVVQSACVHPPTMLQHADACAYSCRLQRCALVCRRWRRIVSEPGPLWRRVTMNCKLQRDGLRNIARLAWLQRISSSLEFLSFRQVRRHALQQQAAMNGGVVVPLHGCCLLATRFRGKMARGILQAAREAPQSQGQPTTSISSLSSLLPETLATVGASTALVRLTVDLAPQLFGDASLASVQLCRHLTRLDLAALPPASNADRTLNALELVFGCIKDSLRHLSLLFASPPPAWECMDARPTALLRCTKLTSLTIRCALMVWQSFAWCQSSTGGQSPCMQCKHAACCKCVDDC